jgi:hypothetical protein
MIESKYENLGIGSTRRGERWNNGIMELCGGEW